MVPPPIVVLGPASLHSRPDPSLHGVSLGTLPLFTRCRKYVVVQRRLHRDGVADLQVARQAGLDEAAADPVGRGELRGGRHRQQLDGRGAGPVQHGVGDQHVEVQFAFIATPADVAVESLEVGGLQVAPAALVQSAGSDVDRRVAALLAVLEVPAVGAERSAGGLDLAALVGEAVLQLHVERAAKGVQAEDRVGALQVHLVDRQAGQQVEVHRVAESLVEAHAVDVDGQPLRGALKGGGGEAVVEQRRLERVAGGGVEVHAADLLIQRADRVGRGGAAARQVLAAEHVGLRRHGVAVDAGAEQR